VKLKLKMVTRPSWTVSSHVASRGEMPRRRNESRATVPEKVTTSGVTATGGVISALKLPAASSRCHCSISARPTRGPVGRLTIAPGANRLTAALTSWAFSAAINARATDTASVWADAGEAPNVADRTIAATTAAALLMIRLSVSPKTTAC
jgi:hypothetical protein